MSKQHNNNAKVLRASPGKQTRVKKNNQQRSLRVMYKSPRTIMPSEFDTVLKYTVTERVANNGGTLASIRYTSNAYDVDPALASTAMAGFSEFAGFYARFRTLAMRYTFDVSNAEAFPLAIVHGFSNAVIASGSLGMNYGENPLFTTGVLGPATGQGRSRLSKNASIMTISGTEQALYDDLFTGSTTSSTLASAGTCHCYFGIAAPTAGSLTVSGCVVQARIELQIRFYRPNLLIT